MDILKSEIEESQSKSLKKPIWDIAKSEIIKKLKFKITCKKFKVYQ